MLSKKDREDFRALRQKRGLHQSRVAEMLGVKRGVISNVEVGRTKFERTTWYPKFLELLNEWREEEREQARVSMVREEGLARDFHCPNCRSYVPGPPAARRCIECGAGLTLASCPHCEAPISDLSARFCPKCGESLA